LKDQPFPRDKEGRAGRAALQGTAMVLMAFPLLNDSSGGLTVATVTAQGHVPSRFTW